MKKLFEKKEESKKEIKTCAVLYVITAVCWILCSFMDVDEIVNHRANGYFDLIFHLILAFFYVIISIEYIVKYRKMPDDAM